MTVRSREAAAAEVLGMALHNLRDAYSAAVEYESAMDSAYSFVVLVENTGLLQQPPWQTAYALDPGIHNRDAIHRLILTLEAEQARLRSVKPKAEEG